MVTTDQLVEYLEKRIASDFLAGHKQSLRDVQTAAGVIMAAAEANGDKDAAQRFRYVASHAANKLEELTNPDE